MNLEIILLFIGAYTLGSIPTGLILTKVFIKKDIRDIGSGNIGATNVLRTGKKFLAFLTLLLDIAKGFLTIFISSKYFQDYIYITGLLCFLGHIFPVWLKFKGGKGIATYLGILLGMSFYLALTFGLSWLIIIYFSRYSSISSMLSSINVTIASYFFETIDQNFFFLILLILIIYSHKENIIRLKNKTEDKIKF